MNYFHITQRCKGVPLYSYLMVNLRIAVASAVLCIVTLNPLWADDTEIFVRASGGRPNVLFVLDASGSMTFTDGGPTTRMQRLNTAMKAVLTEFSNVNVGLMRFSHGFNGGRIIYPVTYLEASLCADGSCDSTEQFPVSSRVSSSTDDAFEDTSGNVILDESVVPMMAFGGDTYHISALRFPELQIPQGATIVDARIEFAPATDASEPTDLLFYVEDTGDAQPYNNSANSIDNRTRASGTIPWDTLSAWSVDNPVLSPDLSPLIQHVVNRTDWCGGNALGINIQGTGSRLAKSFDLNPDQAPLLRIQYQLDNLPATGGCILLDHTPTIQVDQNFHDLEESLTDGGVPGARKKVKPKDSVLGVISSTDYALNVNYQYMIGLEFNNIQLDPGTKIREAYLELKNYGGGIPGQSMIVSLENSSSPGPLSTSNFSLSNRFKTSGVLWENAPLDANATVTSPDITSLVQSRVNSGNWAKGNSINAFIQSNTSNTGPMNSFYSFDADESSAPKLKIRYEGNIKNTGDLAREPVTTVRQALFREIDDMEPASVTPTVGALLEAQRYFAGQPVVSGTKRVLAGTATAKYSRVSHPDSYTNGEVERSSECKDSALSAAECVGEEITGSPVYISPINSECQSNHIVLVTDGKPSGDRLAVRAAESLLGETCLTIFNPGGPADIGGTCGVELAKYLKETDFSSDIPGVQNIKTHTIGFNIDIPWLTDIADASGGSYHRADSATELVTAITDIFATAVDTDATFVAPGATVDRFTSLNHRKDVYLALFKPSANPRWGGNLKKFNFEGTPPQLHDAKEDIAVDEATGFIKSTSRSFWTDASVTDGDNTFLGGAASKLNPNTRVLVSSLEAGNLDLLAAGNRLEYNNDYLANSQLSASSNLERQEILDWLHGFDVKDENEDGLISDYRHHIGDPLHSRPALVTYGGTSAEPDSVVFIGTNEGFLHAFDTKDGTEKYAFMPVELLENLRILYDNETTLKKPYGMDGDIAVRIIDNDNNGIIDTGDAAHLFLGMRRGGRSYYSLDVTAKDSPLLRWQINGGAGNFSELGQTWSKPILSKILLGTEPKDVLVFGGGYDDSQDNNQVRTEDNIGRAVYIVDADSGALIWSGGPSNSSPTKVFPRMLYSIPSDLKIVEEQDGLLSQIFVGDMGGQVWQFDIKNGSSSNNLVEGGVVADLSVNDDPSQTRRFYHAPDLSITRKDGVPYINIAIGSGYHAHPLDRTIKDRFYVIQTPFGYTGNYGFDEDKDGTYLPITEDDLFDTTDNKISEGSDQERADALDELNRKPGWFIKMEVSGEKILGTSSTLNNVVKFTSYVPLASSNICAPNIGSSFFYAVNLADGTPTDDAITDESENDDTMPRPKKADRRKEIPGGGLAPPISTLFVQTDNGISVIDTSGPNVVYRTDGLGKAQRWYWSEYLE